jgi:hypothetical protein
MRDARCKEARQCDFGDLVGAEDPFDDCCYGAADAVRVRVFRMHRGCIDWLPGRIALGGGLPSMSPLRIAVIGRQNSYLYLASKTAITASARFFRATG